MLELSACTHWYKYAHSLKRVRRTCENECAHSFFFVVGGIQRAQGKRIKIQAYYECRRHDTPAKPRVQWGQSPIWNPGYTRIKSNIELRRSGTITRAFVLRLGSAAPLGLINVVQWFTQGLCPGLCRSIALTGLLYVFSYTLLFWYGCPAKVFAFCLILDLRRMLVSVWEYVFCVSVLQIQ